MELQPLARDGLRSPSSSMGGLRTHARTDGTPLSGGPKPSSEQAKLFPEMTVLLIHPSRMRCYVVRAKQYRLLSGRAMMQLPLRGRAHDRRITLCPAPSSSELHSGTYLVPG